MITHHVNTVVDYDEINTNLIQESLEYGYDHGITSTSYSMYSILALWIGLMVIYICSLHEEIDNKTVHFICMCRLVGHRNLF